MAQNTHWLRSVFLLQGASLRVLGVSLSLNAIHLPKFPPTSSHAHHSITEPSALWWLLQILLANCLSWRAVGHLKKSHALYRRPSVSTCPASPLRATVAASNPTYYPSRGLLQGSDRHSHHKSLHPVIHPCPRLEKNEEAGASDSLLSTSVQQWGLKKVHAQRPALLGTEGWDLSHQE